MWTSRSIGVIPAPAIMLRCRDYRCHYRLAVIRGCLRTGWGRVRKSEAEPCGRAFPGGAWEREGILRYAHGQWWNFAPSEAGFQTKAAIRPLLRGVLKDHGELEGQLPKLTVGDLTADRARGSWMGRPPLVSRASPAPRRTPRQPHRRPHPRRVIDVAAFGPRRALAQGRLPCSFPGIR